MLNLAANRLTDDALLQEWMDYDALPSKSGFTLDDDDMALLSVANDEWREIVVAAYEAGEETCSRITGRCLTPGWEQDHTYPDGSTVYASFMPGTLNTVRGNINKLVIERCASPQVNSIKATVEDLVIYDTTDCYLDMW